MKSIETAASLVGEGPLTRLCPRDILKRIAQDRPMLRRSETPSEVFPEVLSTDGPHSNPRSKGTALSYAFGRKADEA